MTMGSEWIAAYFFCLFLIMQGIKGVFFSL